MSKEIGEICDKKGCETFSLISRGQRHMSKLLALYEDAMEKFYGDYEDEVELRIAFYGIGSDLAEGFHYVLGMN